MFMANVETHRKLTIYLMKDKVVSRYNFIENVETDLVHKYYLTNYLGCTQIQFILERYNGKVTRTTKRLHYEKYKEQKQGRILTNKNISTGTYIDEYNLYHKCDDNKYNKI